jgi:HPt (histidine-containing phosphotransfer) domain-containing protein
VPDWRDDALIKYEAFARDRDPALLMKLIELSQDSTRNCMRKIRQAVADNDAKQIEFFAHDLKGSSGSFFARELSARAADLEEVIGDPRRVAEILPRLEAAADDALKWWSDLARRVT